ncbi:hypothetical protein V6N12_068696 [Hibiscus sabdariffa]|uniref:Secreted protein n=1 Tax=Hibiscus sabdariffa TaxID=183260 RepID=A0ABR2FRG0_9ROSI
MLRASICAWEPLWLPVAGPLALLRIDCVADACTPPSLLVCLVATGPPLARLAGNCPIGLCAPLGQLVLCPRKVYSDGLPRPARSFVAFFPAQ